MEVYAKDGWKGSRRSLAQGESPSHEMPELPSEKTPPIQDSKPDISIHVRFFVDGCVISTLPNVLLPYEDRD
ncbi:hypothetical protein ADUPG1_003983, partial [Aduncisulcus paluster]